MSRALAVLAAALAVFAGITLEGPDWARVVAFAAATFALASAATRGRRDGDER